mgnify:CR=1 FL=1
MVRIPHEIFSQFLSICFSERTRFVLILLHQVFFHSANHVRRHIGCHHTTNGWRSHCEFVGPLAHFFKFRVVIITCSSTLHNKNLNFVWVLNRHSKPDTSSTRGNHQRELFDSKMLHQSNAEVGLLFSRLVVICEGNVAVSWTIDSYQSHTDVRSEPEMEVGETWCSREQHHIGCLTPFDVFDLSFLCFDHRNSGIKLFLASLCPISVGNNATAAAKAAWNNHSCCDDDANEGTTLDKRNNF